MFAEVMPLFCLPNRKLDICPLPAMTPMIGMARLSALSCLFRVAPLLVKRNPAHLTLRIAWSG